MCIMSRVAEEPETSVYFQSAWWLRLRLPMFKVARLGRLLRVIDTEETDVKEQKLNCTK